MPDAPLVVIPATPPTPEQEASALAAEQRLAQLADQPAVQANAVTGIFGDSGCLCGTTEVTVKRGSGRNRRRYTLRQLYHKFNGLPLVRPDYVGTDRTARGWDLSVPTYTTSLGDDGVMFYNRIVAVYESGIKPLLRVTFSDGRILKLTAEHPVLTPAGFVVGELLKPGLAVVARGTMEYLSSEGRDWSARPPRVIVNTKHHPGPIKIVSGYEYVRVSRARLVVEAALNDLPYEDFVHALKHNGTASATFRYIPTDFEVHHLDEDTLNDSLDNLVVLTKVEHAKLHYAVATFPYDSTQEITVRLIEPLESEMTYDMLMESPANNFCANGVVVHNSGKTALVATAVRYTWKTFHRTTRYYSGDLGGYGNQLLALARLGQVEIWNLVNHVEPFETIELASMGWWPEQILDPETGYADPYVKLIPPQRRRYTVYCQHGHAQPPLDDKRQLGMFQASCVVCKDTITLQNLQKVEETVVRSKGFKHVGLYVFESGSSLSDHAMNDMAERAGRDELGGEKGAINKLQSGGMTFGSNNRAHYGFAQIRVRQWLANSRRIPGQVVPPIWTFFVDRGSDDRSSPVFGPKIAGNAKTAEVPGWMGNCLHTEKVKNEAGGGDVWRVWTTTHRNAAEGNVPYLAKHRAEPGTFQEPYLQDKPGEAPFTTFSLGYFYDAIAASFEQGLKRDAKLYPDSPALQPFTDNDDEEVIVSTAMATGNLGNIQPPSATVGGVPATMVPGAGGVVPMMLPMGGVVPPAGARPPLPAAPVAQPVITPLERLIDRASVNVTMPTPKGPTPVPPVLVPFMQPMPAPAVAQVAAAITPTLSTIGDPPVMAPQAAPVRPPIPGKK